MHIHLPKPLHGWKEFGNEIFVIVIGVLIALGFEQVVEELHWQHKVHEGQERITNEATINAAYAAEQIASAPCTESQIGELTQRVLNSGNMLTPAPVIQGPSGRTVLGMSQRPYLGETWTALVQDGTVPHFKPSQQKLLGLAYAMVENIRGINHDMRSLRGQLAVLGYPVPLDASSRIQMLELLNQVSSLNVSRTTQAAQLIAFYQAAGIQIDEAFVERFLITAQMRKGEKCRFGTGMIADWKNPPPEMLKAISLVSAKSEVQE